MPTRFLQDRFREVPHDDAIRWHGESFSYAWLLDAIDQWDARLDEHAVHPGTVTTLIADFSPHCVAALFALIQRGAIIVPISESSQNKHHTYEQLAQCEVAIEIAGDKTFSIRNLTNAPAAEHQLYAELRSVAHPGLVLFSSGSTGEPKAAVHDFTRLLDKFRRPGRAQRTLAFLLFDHIGGLNTILHTLGSGGCVVVPANRSTESVLAAIQDHAVQLLPTSPTFLKLLLMRSAWQDYDLSSLQMITYGTEPMSANILAALNKKLPHVSFKQTYGLSEVGILRSKSKDSSSLWMQLGGDGVQTRVVDNILQIKSHSTMLGYLNAASPFSEDGWFVTGDAVELDGEYFKVLGRVGEIINVGGEKVYPAEVEAVIEMMPQVHTAAVYGESNAIMGMIVCARVRLNPEIQISAKELTRLVRQHCRHHLSPKQIPIRVTIDPQLSHDERFKKQRTPRE
ncbi:o-succinylbenzoate--CoA ligase [Rhodopirellula maiorica SM1]|uniref:O-succinylbenzoate--CoA ligase n=1 Tax=Rhodopirellula maiorica SM1 TaxID=1265738 RepID=M5RJX9_9BACT|nr:fatty acid--CoA ligase family protein [Rhodopirellula maiorica]EMI19615.1 o-succinylbenzoate--CoA ligase [Rhodopirellula maiorica SM1]